MKNTKSGFIGIIIAILAALIIAGGAGYFYIQHQNKVASNSQIDFGTNNPDDITYQNTGTTTLVNSNLATTSSNISTKTNITFSVSSTTLSVINNGKVTQTFSLDDLGVFAFNIDPSHPVKAFITDMDVNFDGYNDIGVLDSTGYAGVNYFYDFYLYNPSTGKFEKNSMLTEVPEPQLDPSKKELNFSEKSGPSYTSFTYQWNGSNFVNLDKASDASVGTPVEITTVPVSVSVGSDITLIGSGFSNISRLNFYNTNLIKDGGPITYITNPDYVSSDGTQIKFNLDNATFVNGLHSMSGFYQIAVANIDCGSGVNLSCTSNTISSKVNLTITSNPSSNIPNISNVQAIANPVNQFYPTDEVTLTGTNFPVAGNSSPIVWISTSKVTDVSGLISATANKIVFTAPNIPAGTYNLYVTGTNGVQTSDPSNAGNIQTSNTVQVTVR